MLQRAPLRVEVTWDLVQVRLQKPQLLHRVCPDIEERRLVDSKPENEIKVIVSLKKPFCLFRKVIIVCCIQV